MTPTARRFTKQASSPPPTRAAGLPPLPTDLNPPYPANPYADYALPALVDAFDTAAAKTRPAPPRAAQPAAAKLAPYVGDYPLSRSFAIAITASGDELFAQATKQSRLRLKRVRPDHYAVADVEAAIVFERDSSGAATALILEQNGARQRAPRKPPGGG